MIAFDDLKPLRNRIRKLDRIALIRLAAEQLHAAYLEPDRLLGKWPPWSLMLIIKLSLTDQISSAGIRQPTLRDLADLRNRVWELGNRVRLPDEYGNPLAFFRAMAFQQFPHQTSLTAPNLVRQLILFDELDGASKLRSQFEAVVGISIKVHVELSVILASYFFNGAQPEFTAALFKRFEARFGSAQIGRFLSLLAADRQQARHLALESDQKVRDLDARMYEQSPFRRRPLLALQGGYLCYSPPLLFEAMANAPYDVLKARYGEAFTRDFGTVLEAYLDRLLVEHEIPFLRERDLRRDYPGAKSTDFAVFSDDAAVLIESKAIEMSPLAQVSPKLETLNNHLRNSVTKAIHQAVQTANSIATTPPQGTNSPSREFFALVVTFKELYLGYGEDFIVGDVAHALSDFVDKNGFDRALLPAGNVFFASVQDFELLVATCKKHGISLSTVLREAAAANRDPRSRKLTLSQHIEELYQGETQSPTSLTDRLRELIAAIVGFDPETAKRH